MHYISLIINFKWIIKASLLFSVAFPHACSISDLFDFVLVIGSFPFISSLLIMFDFDCFLLFFHFILLFILFVEVRLF